ncbi:protein cbg [Trichuris trichiura]|uniref:Protein cbg n=1 Tax=Trichuris trichiura TaxID=36087 RepID=A0A077YWN4_TRITR|nr:protein cbg [Trichuris trichiura]
MAVPSSGPFMQIYTLGLNQALWFPSSFVRLTSFPGETAKYDVMKAGGSCFSPMTITMVDWGRLDVFIVTKSGGRPFVDDNEVVGLPKVVCDQNVISFNITTRKPLIGHLYVKGSFEREECRKDFMSNTKKEASISVKVSQCSIKRMRQTHSSSYDVVFVVNFHPLFITKLDRAYNARCFYGQHEKPVTTKLDINTLATDSVHADSNMLPNCQYTIRANTLSGPVVRFVDVGDIVVHRWECDNRKPSFGMLVKNCFVSDGAGRSVRILDSKGCSMLTPIIQGNLQYSASANLASVQVWAYKFPDRSDLFFQCQIQLCHKEKKECSGVTPPRCPTELMEPENQIPMTTLATDSATYVIGTFENFGNDIDEGERSTPPVVPYQQKLKRSVLLNYKSSSGGSEVWTNDSDQMTIATYVKFHVQNASHIFNVTTGRVRVSDVGDEITAKGWNSVDEE